MKMFGGFMNYTFNPVTKSLTVIRKIPKVTATSDDSTLAVAETVLLWIYNYKPEINLLSDHMIYPWIQDYAYALSKKMVGEAREKFAQIAGPQGGTSLNGAALKGEAQATMDQLEKDLQNYVDGSQPITWVIG
jgi:hypothetical protein